ncbi:MAG: hypothetical protein J1E80_08575 [Desulfovibrionaceae bacterium]|nr:hypothetical protein [Desulfovibrionaceae bacterium]
MDIRKVRENLGRIKLYYLKGETSRALGAAVMALKELTKAGASLSTDLRAPLREGVQLLARDKDVKRLYKAPLIYQPGQERALLVVLAKVYKQMEDEAGREDRKEAFARKQRLDQAIGLGRRLLEQGKVSEADASFQEALTHYRNEHRAFQLIGKALLDADQPRRAVPYLKKAMELEPGNSVARELLQSAQNRAAASPLV